MSVRKNIANSENGISIYYIDSKTNFPIGCAETSNMGEFHYFSRLYVQDRYRCQGWGRKLYDELCDMLDKQGIVLMIDINPYGDMNYASLVEFYKSNGAVEREEYGLIRQPKMK